MDKVRKAQTSRKSHLKRKYGITQEQYEELAALWDNKCAICDRTASQKRKSLDIDHCHTHGHIRGVLCDRCNKMLGMIKDDPEILKNAIVYLEAYKESVEELQNAIT